MQAIAEKIELKYDRIIEVAEFKSLTETKSFNINITYGEFLRKLTVPSISKLKGSAGGFVGGYVQDNRNNENVKVRNIITLDIDHVSPEVNVWEKIKRQTSFSVAMYSTHNSTPLAPRYRVIVPLSKSIKPFHYKFVSSYISKIIGVPIDNTSHEFARVMYYPTCSDPDNYEFHYKDEPFFNPNILVKQNKGITLNKESKKIDPRIKRNWIGAFTNIYSITDVLDIFLSDVYEPYTNNRYSLISGDSVGGLVIYDNNTHAHSNHGSDIISGMNVNSFDLVRIHIYGHLDIGNEEMKHKPSFKAMVELCMQDERVKEYYEEHFKLESSTVLKSESKVRSIVFFDDNKKFLHHEFAKHIAYKENIIKLDKRLHIYKEGKYVADEESIKKRIINVIPNLTENRIREVLLRLKLIAMEKEHADPRYIGVKNGVYDLIENKLLDHNPDIVVTNQINANYNPAVKCKEVDNMIKVISNDDKEVIMLIHELIGYCLYRTNIFAKSFLFNGTGGNGKSTLLNTISSLLGEENITALSLSDLSERFKTGLLAGKLANIGDDIPYTSIRDTSLFKKLTSGERVIGEFKGDTPFEFRSFAKLIFSSNKIPKFYDNSEGIMRRLVIIPLTAKLKEKKGYDLFIEKKVTTEQARSHLLNIGITRLKKLLTTGQFTRPSIVNQMLNEFKVNNNPVIEFINEHEVDGRPVGEVYSDYRQFCYLSGHKNPISKNNLTQELEQIGYKSVKSYSSEIKGQRRLYIKSG